MPLTLQHDADAAIAEPPMRAAMSLISSRIAAW
jgi:hypothetical protein